MKHIIIVLLLCISGCDNSCHHHLEPLNIHFKPKYVEGIKTEPATMICNGVESKVLIEKEYWAIKNHDTECLTIKD